MSEADTIISDANAFATTDGTYQTDKTKVAADQANVDQTQATVNADSAAIAAYKSAHDAVTSYLAQFPPGNDNSGFDANAFAALVANFITAAAANVSPTKTAADLNEMANVTAQRDSDAADAAMALAADQAAYNTLKTDVEGGAPQ